MAVKWFVPEEGSERARRLKRSYEAGDIDLLSPRLMAFEVANALRYHPRIKMSVSDLVVAVLSLRDMSIAVDMRKEGWHETFELSLRENVSAYDAAYLALAVQSEAVFVTADEKLLEGLSDELKKNVLQLSAFE